MKKGKRNLIFQTKGGIVSFNAYEVEKKLYQELKNNGITYGQDINYYINMDELKAYCVIDKHDLVTIDVSEMQCEK